MLQLGETDKEFDAEELLESILTMVETGNVTYEEMILWFGRADDRGQNARRQHILGFLLKEIKAQQLTIGWMEGELAEARTSVRRVLAARQLMPSQDDDARINACNQLETLRRWLDQAVTAASIADALA